MLEDSVTRPIGSIWLCPGKFRDPIMGSMRYVNGLFSDRVHGSPMYLRISDRFMALVEILPISLTQRLRDSLLWKIRISHVFANPIDA